MFSLVVNDEVFNYGMFWRIVTESFWEKFSHDLPRSKLFNTRFCLQVRSEQAHLQSGQNKAPLGEKMFFLSMFPSMFITSMLSLLNCEHLFRSSLNIFIICMNVYINVECLSFQSQFQVEEINDDFDDMDEDIESFRCTC